MVQPLTGQRLCEYTKNQVLHLIYAFANAFGDFSEGKGQLDEADVDQKKETRSTEKPAVQLTHFLKEPKKDGPFTALRVDQPDGAGETAFIGSWARK
jgi:hypothetical protein